MAETRPNEYLLELIDILARPIQDGGEGMADNQDSPLMRLREKIAPHSCKASDAWAFDCALTIVNGAYSLHGRPIIGNSNEVEANKLAEMILRFHESCGGK